MLIKIQKEVDAEYAELIAEKLDKIMSDIISQVIEGKGKIVVFTSEDHEITNWERVICRK